ncbi:cation channel sperm-associated protein 1 [Lepus europaeus]|uniref:cation channel sperm-associated protein 1 n=1 Tax=Lepus europaeus TaxID=9983 RepID=UPI002B479251|nr:cation channel sperm-associated protein 1 [Lepus europaeus]
MPEIEQEHPGVLPSATAPSRVLDVTKRFTGDPIRILAEKDEFTLEERKPDRHRPGHGGALRHHGGASQHRDLARPHGGPRHPREFQDNQDDRAFSHHAPLGLTTMPSLTPTVDPTTLLCPLTTVEPTTLPSPLTMVDPTIIPSLATMVDPTTILSPATTVGPITMLSLTPTAGPIILLCPLTMAGPTTTLSLTSMVGPTTTPSPLTMEGPTTMPSPLTTVGPGIMLSLTPMVGPITLLCPLTTAGPSTTPSPLTTAGPTTTLRMATVEGPTTTPSPLTTAGPTTTLRTATVEGPTTTLRTATVEGCLTAGSSNLSHPAIPHADAHRWSSGHSTAPSHVAISGKVYSQESSSKDLENYTEDSEQLRKRKTRRTPRSYKKLHLESCFQWWCEKLVVLFRGLQRMLWKLTHCLAFETFIFLVVCLNTTMLVAQTFAEVEIRGEWHFLILDCIFLCTYMVEALLKIIALGFSYFRDFWNNLDFCIMMVAVLDFTLMQLNSLSYSFYHQSLFRILKVFKSMRALRAIRVLRRLSFLTSLHEVTGTLARSLPSITAILILMFTCLFLFSVVLRALFRKSDPKRFQNIFSTLFTLFTMLTLDDWSLIYMDNRAQGAWYIIPILMVYIIIQYFIFLNLVIAVLVDNFQMALLKGLEKVRQERAARIQENLLDDSLTELRQAEPEEIRSEGTMQRQLLEKKFGTMTEKQRELLFQFLQLVAGVEQQQQKFRSQASVIDEIVDTAFEAGEEDFRK